jgi:hypothetical protein
MSSLMALIAPLALTAAAPQAAEAAQPEAAVEAPSEWIVEWSLSAVAVPRFAPLADEGHGVWSMIADSFRADPAEQVRIEQRMVIRITPLGPQREMLADLPRAPIASRFSERKIGKCVPVAGIAGVQIGGDDRLMLFMRDQRLIGAKLDKACRARDFYSGFYVERSRDGKLCVDRDMIHSRSGATCSLSRMRQLIAVDD